MMDKKDIIKFVLEQYAFNDLSKIELEIEEKDKDIFRIKYFSKNVGLDGYNIDLERKICYGGTLQVFSKNKGLGYGRKLVESREMICDRLGIDLLIINDNQNPSFWDHIGYQKLGFIKKLFWKNRLNNVWLNNQSKVSYKRI